MQFLKSIHNDFFFDKKGDFFPVKNFRILPDFFDLYSLESDTKTKAFYKPRLIFLKKLDLLAVVADERIKSLPMYVFIFKNLNFKFTPVAFSLDSSLEFEKNFFFNYFDSLDILHEPLHLNFICKGISSEDYLRIYYRIFSFDSSDFIENTRVFSLGIFYNCLYSRFAVSR
jgi:hypothetical protein